MSFLRSVALVALFLVAAADACGGDALALKGTVALPEVPERIFTNSAGNVCVDFGKDAFGWVEIHAPAAGLEYFVGLAECLLENGSIDRLCGRYVRAYGIKWHTERTGFQRVPIPVDLRHSFSVKEGSPIALPDEFGTVTPFRAVEIYSADFPVTMQTIRRYVVRYPADYDEARFVSSDIRLNAVWEFCKYSMFATSFAGQFVDGDRERIPYEADSYAAQLNWYAVSSDYAYPRHSIEYLYAHPTWPTEFRQVSVLSAWADWMWTGDRGSITRNFDLLKRHKLLLDYRRKDGLLVSGGERRPHPHTTNGLGLADIVDWPKAERDGFDFRDVNAVVNAFHYKGLRQMSEIALALNKIAEAEDFSRMADETYVSYQRAFFNEETGLYVDGEGSCHSALHPNALALAFGLVPQDRIGRVADWLESRGMVCSVYFAQYLLEALYRANRADGALKLLTATDNRSWLGMLKMGATITTEAWNMEVKPNMDWNHAWGATAANVISRFVVGVTPLEPGFKRIRIAPNVGSLSSIAAEVPTPIGRVSVSVSGDCLKVLSPAPASVVWGRETHCIDALTASEFLRIPSSPCR